MAQASLVALELCDRQIRFGKQNGPCARRGSGKFDFYSQGQAGPEVLLAALAGGASFGEDVGIGVVFEPGATAHAGDHMAVGAAAHAHGQNVVRG